MKDREYIKFLEDRGYKRYSPSVIDGEGVTDCFQKRFDDEKGKKYFINVKRWDFSRFSSFQSVPDPISYPADGFYGRKALTEDEAIEAWNRREGEKE